eukprot:6182108-Pleurochrysis_carterae.AAC.1
MRACSECWHRRFAKDCKSGVILGEQSSEVYFCEVAPRAHCGKVTVLEPVSALRARMSGSNQLARDHGAEKWGRKELRGRRDVRARTQFQPCERLATSLPYVARFRSIETVLARVAEAHSAIQADALCYAQAGVPHRRSWR